MRAEQTVDLGISRQSIAKYLEQIGYWSSDELRRRNAYVLSPAAYVVSQRQREDLERLSRAAYTGVQTLSQKLTALGRSSHLTKDDSFFLGLSKNGVRGLLKPSETDGRIPDVMKVDLVQDKRGSYHIAEVDVYNPRGFGYLAFLDETLPSQTRRAGPGIKAIAESMKQFAPNADWSIIVSEYERYYHPTYSIFAQALRKEGIRVGIIRERDLAESSESLGKLSHVLAVPDTLYKHPEVRTHLLSRYKDGTLQAYFPPTAYLGSKAFLPFYASDHRLAEFVPPSALVSRKDDPWQTLPADEPAVLKGVMSSGHKQVIFRSRDPQRFESTLSEARKTKHAAWIMQKEVPQAKLPVVVFDDAGNRLERDYYLRLTAYVGRDSLVGLEATGREVALVHGAPDCIQIPAILG